MRIRETRMTVDDLLAERRVVPLGEAARALSLNPRTLRKLLGQHSMPVVEFAQRCRGVRITDLDKLIAAHERPAA